MCWIPINYHDERLRNGCKALTFYEGMQINHHQHNNNANTLPNSFLSEPGWIMSGKTLVDVCCIVNDRNGFRWYRFTPTRSRG